MVNSSRLARIAHLKRDGITYTDAKEVYEEYGELINAAAVLGRPDLATALQTRVTHKLCQKYAPLLRVLRLCAGDVLNQPLPVFTYPVPTVHDDIQKLYEDIEKETPEVEMYTGGDTEDEWGSDLTEAAESEDGACAELGTDHLTEPEHPNENDKAAAEVLQKYAIHPLQVESPHMLSHEEFVREAALLVLGKPCYEGVPLAGVSMACSQSLWTQFAELAHRMDSPPPADILASRSLVMLLASVELQAVSVGSENRHEITPTNLSCVESWLQGDISNWPFTDADLTDWCPVDLQRPQLYEACLYAVLSRKVYKAVIPPVRLPRDSSLMYTLSIQQHMLGNGHYLLNSGLRDLLIRMWRRLAAVFLAQDARMLLFLDMWYNHPESQNRSANTILSRCWPDSQFSITADEPPIPSLKFELPEPLVQVFGSNFEKLFRPAALKAAWYEVIAAFQDGNQIVEFAMIKTAHSVEQQIRTQLVPGQYFPLSSRSATNVS